MLKPYLIAKTRPKADERQIIRSGRIRITVLAPELLRAEVSKNSTFCDEATQIVWYRDLGACPYTYTQDDKTIRVQTETAEFVFNKKKARFDCVILDGEQIPYDPAKNLKGTARTLDATFGPIPLEDGILAENGFSCFEDDSLIIDEKTGMVCARKRETDIYAFAGKNYKTLLQRYFAITGMPPMVPRYALGNWWSRYHKYTQQEYLDLMERFEKEEIPFSVATIDMDWHWVDVKKRFKKDLLGKSSIIDCNWGWTGYSWNTEFFPDYKEFLQKLNQKNYAPIMNLHPADGVRPYEDMYEQMCAAVGQDPKEKKRVKFDLTSEKFINAYFSVLHNPYEDAGIAAWWIDWQQGKRSKLKGFDPLWGLNHYHFLDSARNLERRPFVLSRYGGLGSHRYPLGFSGDTAVLWECLKFQPYFTANAANAGYYTWSHDIGGHHMGNQSDEELYLRWLQFGVFSPVLRMHSTASARSKEPWNYPKVETLAKTALKLRHQMIPYLYTLYYRSNTEGTPICEPMYYRQACNEAYQAKNQYYFGDLIVAPVVEPSDAASGLSSVSVWLPEGTYTDIFTGERYTGGKLLTLQRDLSSIPVLAPEGTILPLAVTQGNDVSNPKEMDLWIFAGNGSFELYEDDGISNSYQNGCCAFTGFRIQTEGNELTFTIDPVRGEASVTHPKRTYHCSFKDIDSFDDCAVLINDQKKEANLQGSRITVDLNAGDRLTIKLSGLRPKQ